MVIVPLFTLKSHFLRENVQKRKFLVDRYAEDMIETNYEHPS